jgi:UDPglucose 6-dehydrogenase
LKSLIQDEYDQRELSLREGLVFDVVNNPEFLREGSAVKDFTDPDRVIVGVESDQAGEIMRKLYEPLIERGISYMETSCSNAEAIKYASNAFLATKISFVNEMAMLCEKYGANIEEVALGMGMDPRIAPAFLKAGIGYGGSCLPKDVAQLIVSGQSQGVDMLLLKAVNEINQAQSDRFIDRLKEVYPDLSGLTVAVWGLTFKPETDDIREAAAFRIIPKLLKKGVTVQVFDPEGMENAKAQLGESVVYAKTPYKALEAADGLLILTEWDVFRNADLVEVKKHLKKAVVIDGRNLYDLNEMESMEFIYRSIGRTLKSIN